MQEPSPRWKLNAFYVTLGTTPSLAPSISSIFISSLASTCDVSIYDVTSDVIDESLRRSFLVWKLSPIGLPVEVTCLDLACGANQSVCDS